MILGMKNLILILCFVCATGCAAAPTPDVVESLEVLRDNTHKLSTHYTELLKRSGPKDPEDDKSTKEWSQRVKHDTMLMEANNQLADKMLKWAQVASGEKETNQ